MNTKKKDLELFFWEWFPHETSWEEFKEANLELYCRVVNAGCILVVKGKLDESYLPKGVV